LLLIGFAGALRRSELVGLDMAQVIWTGDGLKLLIERSKTDKPGKGAEIAIPRGQSEETCPVMALQTWLTTAEITAGPLFRKVNRGGVVEPARLSPDAVRQILLKRAAQAGLKGRSSSLSARAVCAPVLSRPRIAMACPTKKSWATRATAA
jgi:integrase